MITVTTEDLYEALVLWRAYQALLERLAPDVDARTLDPGRLTDMVAGYGRARAAAALFADGATADLADAEHVLDELLGYAGAGRRPRYGTEIYPDFIVRILLLDDGRAAA